MKKTTPLIDADPNWDNTDSDLDWDDNPRLDSDLDWDFVHEESDTTPANHIPLPNDGPSGESYAPPSTSPAEPPKSRIKNRSETRVNDEPGKTPAEPQGDLESIEITIPLKTNYMRPIPTKGGRHIWKDVYMGPSPDKGQGLFAKKKGLSGTLIPILGVILTDEELIDMEKEGTASHTWSFSRTTHMKHHIQGAIDGRMLAENGTHNDLFMAMVINEPSGDQQPNCIFKQGFILICKDVEPGTELLIWYGNEDLAIRQREIAGYKVDYDNCTPDLGEWDKIIPTNKAMSDELQGWLKKCPRKTSKGKAIQQQIQAAYAAKIASRIKSFGKLYDEDNDDPTSDTNIPKRATINSVLDEFRSLGRSKATLGRRKTFELAHEFAIKHGKAIKHWHPRARTKPTPKDEYPTIQKRLWAHLVKSKVKVCIATKSEPSNAYQDTAHFDQNDYSTMTGDKIRNEPFRQCLVQLSKNHSGRGRHNRDRPGHECHSLQHGHRSLRNT
jgi:hypothetical protein